MMHMIQAPTPPPPMVDVRSRRPARAARGFDHLAAALALAGVFLLLSGGLVLGVESDQPGEALEPTIIRSKGPLTMRNNGVEAHFVWTDEVILTGTNLQVTCDQLEVFAERKSEEKGTEAGIGSFQGIRRILATGSVVITQEGRTATAARVEVLPEEDIIVLTGDPAVTDPAGTAKGSKITFFRGKQEFEIEDPQVIMRTIPNLGFPQQGPKTDGPDGSAPVTPALPPAP